MLNIFTVNVTHRGLAVPGDAEDGVAEAGLEVGQVHGVHVLVQDQLKQNIFELLLNIFLPPT